MLRHPREDPQIATITAVEHGGLRVVAHQGNRPRTCRNATDGGQRQRRQLRVAQRVRAHGETVVVLEQTEGHFVTRPQKMRFITDTPEPDDQMGQPSVHLRHQVEQARPAGQDHLGPADGDLRVAGPVGPDGPVDPVGPVRPHSPSGRCESQTATKVRKACSRSGVIPSTADPRPPDRTTESRTAEA